MFAKAFFIIVIWQIICKIHINNILLQISGVSKVENIGIFFVVLFRIGFRQFTFSNAGNALEKNFSVVAQQMMQCGKFIVSSTEMTARLRNPTIIYKVFHDRRKGSCRQQLLGIGVTLHKRTLHAKAQCSSKESCFILFCFTRIILEKLLLGFIGYSCILHQNIIDFLHCHSTVIHQRKYIPVHIRCKEITFVIVHIISGDARADFCLTIKPTADQTIIKIKVF